MKTQNKTTIKEFYLWGDRNGERDLIKINGVAKIDNLIIAKRIKVILEERNEFQNISIQTIDLSKPFNFVSEVLK